METMNYWNNINEILNRNKIENDIKNILNDFSKNYNNVNYKKGIYIYGDSGSGKTKFVHKILKDLNYDIINYDAGDIRNKSLIDTITSNNISNHSVLDMLNKTKKKIAIVMDEIDGMNNGDKGGIASLIKLIRQKKTKKQRLENVTLNPIICIGNYFFDKKIKELMKVCNVFELKSPTNKQIEHLLNNYIIIDKPLQNKVIKFIQNDLRKLQFIEKISKNEKIFLNDSFIDNILQHKSHNEDSKKITSYLFNNKISINDHNLLMNENDRTIVSLLWHENIIDIIEKNNIHNSNEVYLEILDNICFADYIDRITFQNQIWQFNEMSSLIKTFYNNKIFHNSLNKNTKPYNIKSEDIRFTKVLTKYSTEYNNQLFIFNMCQSLDLDKKDLIAFFQELRLFLDVDIYNNIEEIEKYFIDYDINKLDIKRIFRFLDKNVKKDINLEILNEDE